eukprot:31416-Pelagococcus_subviridis.AAC.19
MALRQEPRRARALSAQGRERAREVEIEIAPSSRDDRGRERGEHRDRGDDARRRAGDRSRRRRRSLLRRQRRVLVQAREFHDGDSSERCPRSRARTGVTTRQTERPRNPTRSE